MDRKTICNMCGQEFDEFDEIERFGFHHRVGLGSCFYSKIVECELCCSCFDRMMKEYILPNCKINPIIGSTMRIEETEDK